MQVYFATTFNFYKRIYGFGQAQKNCFIYICNFFGLHNKFNRLMLYDYLQYLVLSSFECPKQMFKCRSGHALIKPFYVMLLSTVPTPGTTRTSAYSFF
ncbi:hypothetical protein Anas_01463 [Armadillidium nasatum]|uniref:Uncharacterized protein n=1 Tax=Armadillidium nasatum TaxID=96803 RepID=A0A5N5TGR8_9CRUS|nr:hypothetical protein Anas_01463 [Armadillidium nasatum]